MNKIIYSLLISGTICSLNAFMAIAKEDVNIREKPSIDSEILGTLAKGKQIEVESKVNTLNWPWYKTVRGYISYDLLKVIESDKLTQVQENQGVKIYEEASFTSKIVDTVSLSYLDEERATQEKYVKGDSYLWFKITKGWVNVSYLKKAQKDIEDEKTEVVEEKKVQSKTTSEGAVLIDNTTPKVKSLDKDVVLSQEEVIATKQVQGPIQNETDTLREKEKKAEAKETKAKPKEAEYNYFLGVGLNYNNLTVNKTDITGEIILNEALDDSASSVSFQAGTKLQNYVLSVNYEVVNLDDVNMDSIYLSLDYEFDTFLNPFIGISLGMSNLEWQTDPLVNSKTKDEKLSSLMYGVQAGINYPIYQNWSIYSILSYQKLDFTTTLTSTPAKAKVTHEDKVSVGAGVRYSF